MTQVCVPIIEPILALLQVQVEGPTGDSVELLQSSLGEAPEALNAVDVMCAAHELVLPMMNSEVLGITNIDQTVLATPPIRVDNRFGSHATANNGLKCGFLAVRHNPGINAAVAFEDAEDDGLATGSTASLAPDSTSAKVAFIYFNFARGEGRGALTFFSDTLSEFEKDRGGATARQSRQLSHVTGCQIEREVAQELTEFTAANFRPPVIAV
jgi:hypothetical protein